VAAVLGIALFFTSKQATQTADTTVNRALAAATDQINTQLDARRRALVGSADIFVKDPKFYALVQSKTKLADLLDQSIEAAERTGANWVQVTDEAGIRLAKSDEPAAPQDDLSGSALISGALGGKPAQGYGRDSTRLLQLISVPVVVSAR
jgi:sensor histidine kinase regulating citrate/malate metabolism